MRADSDELSPELRKAALERPFEIAGGDQARIAGWWVNPDGRTAFPEFFGIPTLLLPEMRTLDEWSPPDTSVPPYAEAYEEMEFYSGVTEERMADFAGTLEHEQLLRVSKGDAPGEFPNPPEYWLGRSKSALAQHSAFEFLAPLREMHTVQVGGHGQYAIEMLLGGAASATLVSPVLGELEFERRMAERAGVKESP